MSKIKFLFSFALILNFSVNAFSYNSTLSSNKLVLKCLDYGTVAGMSTLQPNKKYQLVSNHSKEPITINSTLCTDEDEQESATQTEIDKAFQSKEVISGILNIDWNMDPETAVDQLKKLGCTNFTHYESDNFMAVEGISGHGNITCDGNICCDGVVFNSLTLNYIISSHSQRKYMTGVRLFISYDNEDDANNSLIKILDEWEDKYGAKAMKEIEDPGITMYKIYDPATVQFSATERASAFITNNKKETSLHLVYSCALEASLRMSIEIRFAQSQSENEFYSKKPIDGILGLHWGMKIEEATNEFEKIGLTNWTDIDNASKDGTRFIEYGQKISCDGILYDGMFLCYLTSNKQNKYLSNIILYKGHNSEEDADFSLKLIADKWEDKYGAKANIEIDESSGTTIFAIYDGEYSTSTSPRLIAKKDSTLIIYVYYMGFLEAMRIVDMDDFE